MKAMTTMILQEMDIVSSASLLLSPSSCFKLVGPTEAGSYRVYCVYVNRRGIMCVFGVLAESALKPGECLCLKNHESIRAG